MDISFLGGPAPQRGVGVVAPFDFALDRELWRWVPDDVSLHMTRTPFVPVEVSLDLARMVSEHETLGEAVRTLNAIAPQVVAYACTSGSFVGGIAGERAMCEAMTWAGAVPSVTTSGALLDALTELGVRRVALVTPYTVSVTRALEAYVAEGRCRHHRLRLHGTDPAHLEGPLPRRRRHGPSGAPPRRERRTPCSSPAPTSPPTTSSRSWRPSCGSR
ncbi:hypothetical protein RKD48_005075 [Streptomyces ambofaciens]